MGRGKTKREIPAKKSPPPALQKAGTVVEAPKKDLIGETPTAMTLQNQSLMSTVDEKEKISDKVSEASGLKQGDVTGIEKKSQMSIVDENAPSAGVIKESPSEEAKSDAGE